ncbi:unnamed protein product [Effrenium voratum]|uniref:Dystroglycan-type cadherin-like domain-containing protein n=1 Tax=Effrenium voratum TaxID=2562239 RepID=A0AA36MJY2_9DINO|nr:unnamed protein product [Effrenium voratum]
MVPMEQARSQPSTDGSHGAGSVSSGAQTSPGSSGAQTSPDSSGAQLLTDASQGTASVPVGEGTSIQTPSGNSGAQSFTDGSHGTGLVQAGGEGASIQTQPGSSGAQPFAKPSTDGSLGLAPIAMPMAPVPATEKTPFEYDVPLAVFSDPDGGPLTLSAFLADGKPLPSWLRFDPKKRSFSGTPPNQDQLQIMLKATDPQGLSAVTSFTLQVSPGLVPAEGTSIYSPDGIHEAGSVPGSGDGTSIQNPLGNSGHSLRLMVPTEQAWSVREHRPHRAVLEHRPHRTVLEHSFSLMLPKERPRCRSVRARAFQPRRAILEHSLSLMVRMERARCQPAVRVQAFRRSREVLEHSLLQRGW